MQTKSLYLNYISELNKKLSTSGRFLQVLKIINWNVFFNILNKMVCVVYVCGHVGALIALRSPFSAPVYFYRPHLISGTLNRINEQSLNSM